MAWIKKLWKDRVVENPLTYNKVDNPDGTMTLTPAEGAVVEAGTAITAANMNNIEDGINEAHVGLSTKEPTITKKTGFNLDKSDSIILNDTNSLATSKAIKLVDDKVNSNSARLSAVETKANTNETNIGANNTAILALATEVETAKTYASDGKQAVANAITGMGGTASGTDTFAQLATAITGLTNMVTNGGWIKYSTSGEWKTIDVGFKPSLVIKWRCGVTNPTTGDDIQTETLGNYSDMNLVNMVIQESCNCYGFDSDRGFTDNGFKAYFYADEYYYWIAIK